MVWEGNHVLGTSSLGLLLIALDKGRADPPPHAFFTGTFQLLLVHGFDS